MTECDLCGAKYDEITQHYLCTSCGYRSHCCSADPPIERSENRIYRLPSPITEPRDEA